MTSDYDAAASTDIVEDFYIVVEENGWRLQQDPVVTYHSLEVLKDALLRHVIPMIDDMMINGGEA